MQRVRPTTHLSSEKQTRRELDCLRIRERVSWLTCSCQRILAALRTVHARVGSEGAITHRSPSAWLPATLTARECARSPQHRQGKRSSGPEYFPKKKSPGFFPTCTDLQAHPQPSPQPQPQLQPQPPRENLQTVPLGSVCSISWRALSGVLSHISAQDRPVRHSTWRGRDAPAVHAE